MMNKAKYAYYLAIICLIFSLNGCARNKRYQSRAETQLKQGNYESATYYAIEALKLKPGFRKAQITLKDSYPLAILARSERIMMLQERDGNEKWEVLLTEYLALEQLNNAIRSLPPLINPDTGMRINLDVRDYSTQIYEAKQKTADYYYQKGVHQSRMDSSKEGQRIAAEYFKKAMEFLPNYLDSASRYEAARQKAVTRIAILPFEDKSGSGNRYGATPDILVDMIIGKLLHGAGKPEYTELITRDRIDQVLHEQQLGSSGLVDESSAAAIGHLLGAHVILSGKLLQVNYSAPRTVRNDFTETAKIAPNDGESEEEIQVSCKFSQYTRSSSLQILASYTLVDVATGKIHAHKNFNPQHRYEESWARILEGDERALNAEQLALVKKREALAPSATDMVNIVLEDLSNQITLHLANQLK